MERVKILYVDDNPVNLKVFHNMFGSFFDLALADSSAGALNYLKTNPEVKVLVSDWQMPRPDGLELIDLVLQLDRDILCFMVSDNENTVKAEPYLRSGKIRKYFRKPLNKKLFMREMRRYFMIKKPVLQRKI